MTADIVPTEKRRYWLLTSPRTASNLLVRILNLDEQGVRPSHQGGYFFMSHMVSRLVLYNKPAEEWTPEEAAASNQVAKVAFNNIQDYVEAAEEAGEKVFVKEHVPFLGSVYAEAEHVFGVPVKREGPSSTVEPMRGLTKATQSTLNMTCLPDEFLKTWHPTFLIRHPAVMLPSLYRTALKDIVVEGKKRGQREPYDVEVKTFFLRKLHDFYVEHFGKDSQWPIVLDADDIMAYPELVIKYCGLVGLDAEKTKFSWEKADEEKISHTQKIMLSSINGSTGVDKAKMAGNIDIDKEAVKWRAEFGEEGGRKLERWVREAMPDYEHLHARRLKLD